MKPANGRYQPATQVKVLSPVIINVRKADSFHMLEGDVLYFDKARNTLLPRGLRPWDGIEWIVQELGRSILFPEKGYLQTSRRSKDVEMAVWKSDCFIVAKKQGNACGAKGATLLCKGEEQHKPSAERG